MLAKVKFPCKNEIEAVSSSGELGRKDQQRLILEVLGIYASFKSQTQHASA